MASAPACTGPSLKSSARQNSEVANECVKRLHLCTFLRLAGRLDERRKSALGRATHPRRTAQARFEVAQSSFAKYMVKRRAPPSQGWRTFLRNHAPVPVGNLIRLASEAESRNVSIL